MHTIETYSKYNPQHKAVIDGLVCSLNEMPKASKDRAMKAIDIIINDKIKIINKPSPSVDSPGLVKSKGFYDKLVVDECMLREKICELSNLDSCNFSVSHAVKKAMKYGTCEEQGKILCYCMKYTYVHKTLHYMNENNGE